MSQAAAEVLLERAREHCATRGSRLTTKRRQVLAGLLASDKALSAYELIDRCRRDQGAELLPMSVYRILEFLESEGLVHRLDLANKYVACSHIACSHEHEIQQFLICKTCHRVREIHMPHSALSSIADSVESAGYRLARRQIELECICHRCASAPERLS